MTWVNEAITGARGGGCPKCLVGRNDMMADPAFVCDVCAGTGVPNYQELSAAEDLLAACKRALEPEGALMGASRRGDIRAAIERAEAFRVHATTVTT